MSYEKILIEFFKYKLPTARLSDRISAMEKDENAEIEVKRALYEVAYLFLPILGEDDVSNESLKLKKLITDAGGEIVTEGSAKKIDLAYSISKMAVNKKTTFHDAYFGWIKIKISKTDIETLKKSMDSFDNILRYMIVSTIMLSEPPKKIFKQRTPKKIVKPEVSAPIDEKALDREIEGLLVE